jgi:predicted esterase
VIVESEESFRQEITRGYDLFVPSGDEPRPLLIAAHGYGQEKGWMMRMAREIAADGMVVASLQAPYPHIHFPQDRSTRALGYGFGWLTSYRPEESVALHHDAVGRIIGTLSGRGAIDPTRVFVLGFSQSVALNLRVAFSEPELIRGVIGICGGIPGDWESSDRYCACNVEVLYIGGRSDQVYSPEKLAANAEALRSRARSVDLRIYDVGHEMPRMAFGEIGEWIAARS